jgi:hypothetical protein
MGLFPKRFSAIVAEGNKMRGKNEETLKKPLFFYWESKIVLPLLVIQTQDLDLKYLLG